MLKFIILDYNMLNYKQKINDIIKLGDTILDYNMLNYKQ